METEIFNNSLILFRRVKMVTVANDAGEDIVPPAISEISRRPYCVLFPYRFARSAKLYKDGNPEIPIIFLEGRNTQNTPEFDYKYKTDLENDFLKAGTAASLLAAEGKIIVFLENSIETQGKEAFSKGLGEEKVSNASFYTNYSNYRQIPEVSCAVIAGIGGELMEENAELPVIFVSWLDPAYFPLNVFMVIDDSPIAQIKGAFRLFSAGEKEGVIGSKIHVRNTKIINRKLLRKIKKIR